MRGLWIVLLGCDEIWRFCVLFSNVLRLGVGNGGALGIFRELDRQIGLVKYSKQF